MKFAIFGFRIEIRRAPRVKPQAKPMKRPEGEASDDFWRVFSDSGTLVLTCVCGRTHFCSNTTLDYEEGELEGLLAKAAVDPSKYIQDTENDSVGVMHIGGVCIAWGCPCLNAAKYEDFIWENRKRIVDYLKRRADRRYNEISANVVLIEDLGDLRP